MSLPTNDKKKNSQAGNNIKKQGNDSKFIKGGSKPGVVTKKVRSTGANRGS